MKAVIDEVLGNHFRAVAEEMSHIVLRAAHTTFVKETQDYAAALVTPDGEVTYQDCSRAGTAHNGALLEEPVRLSLGDRLTIGPYQLVVAADPTPQVQRASSQRA